MDRELYANALNKTLQPGDQLIKKNGCEVIYQERPLAWYGRLGNPGALPGLYRDRYHLIVKNSETIEEISIDDAIYKDCSLLEKRLAQLPEKWQGLNFEADCRSPGLPPTFFQESDTVHLIDKNHS